MTVSMRNINTLVGPKSPGLFLNWGIPACIISSFFALFLLHDLRTAIPAFIGITALITIFLCISLFAGEKGKVSWSPAAIIWIAVILRLLFLLRPPELSDDIHRYLWDGLRTLSGQNPYATAPASEGSFNQTAPALLRSVNHPELITIYPPAAQIVFGVGTLFGKSILGIKALLSALDIITCVLIIRLLSTMRLPALRSVLYAWHPLPVIEIAASGHIDGAGSCFFLAALLLLTEGKGIHPSRDPSNPFTRNSARRRLLVVLAGAAFSFAALVKLFPLLFLPALLLLAGRRNVLPFLVGFSLAASALIIPFLPDLANMLGTLHTYLMNWEFSGLAFRSLRLLVSSGSIVRAILALVFVISVLLLYLTSPVNRACAPFRLLYHVTFVFLFLSPTLYPWYALFLVCLLPFVAGTAGLAFSWSVFLSYGVLIRYFLVGQWNEWSLTPLLIWLAPAAAYLITLALKRMRISPAAPPLRIY